MDLRESLAQETSTAVRRALGERAQQSQRRLDAFQETLRTAIDTLQSAVRETGEDFQEAELSGLIDRLAALAAVHAQAAADVVRVEGERALAVVDGKRADAERSLAEVTSLHNDAQLKLGEAEEKIRALLATLEERRRRQEALVTSVGDLQAQVEMLQAEVERERAGAADVARELAEATAARQKAEASVQDADAARRQHEHARKALERELLEIRASLDKSRADSAAIGARLDSELAERASLQKLLAEARERIDGVAAERDAQAAVLEERNAEIQRLEQTARGSEQTRRELQVKLDAAAGREASLRSRLAAAEVDASEARAHAEAVIRDAAAAPAPAAVPAPAPAPVVMAAPSPDLDRLLAVYDELENGTSETAVLTALTKGVSTQFARVALFGVTGNALQGAYQLGFDIDKDITKIAVPMTMESVLTRAFSSGRLETEASDNESDRIGLPFGGVSAWCMALPVTLKGETLAVIYADQGEHTPADPESEASRLAFAELLRRHASPVLMKLAVDLKAWAELRDYAALLLDELEYVYASDVTAGKSNAELVERLTENLRCAQDSFARRRESVAASDSGSDLFEDRLNAVLDGKGATAFGRHLSVAAAAIIASKPATQPSSQPAAQAS